MNLLARGRLEVARERFTLCLLGGALWISLISLPYVPEHLSLDFSWMMSLVYFWEHRLRAGIDWTFTYGPLGFLTSFVYDPVSLGPKLLWEVGFKSVVVFLALRRFRQISSVTIRHLYAIALLLFLADYDYPDSGYQMGLFLLGIRLVQTGAAPRWVAIGAPLLAALALIKFSLFVLVLLNVAAVAIAAQQSRGALYALGTLVYFAVAFCAAWLAGDPSLGDLPSYLRCALWVASGYDEAMGTEARPQAEALGIIVLALDTVWIGRSALADGRDWRRILVAALAAASLALAWKHGFVGSGGLHFFTFAGLLPFLLDLPSRLANDGRVRASSLALVIALAATGVLLSSDTEPGSRSVVQERAERLSRNLSALLHASDWRESSERALEALRAGHDLPRVRERVGRETIDILSFDQGVVILNGLNWKPRPVFQSYFSYTPQLARLNAEFFESEAAPRFLLFRLQSVNGRLPTLDDSAALRVILGQYEPVITERWFLLLERKPASAPHRRADPEVVLERTGTLGESVDVSAWSGQTLLARLDVRYTLLGRIRRILLRAPPVLLETKLESGDTLRYRIEPTMASQSFVLSPSLPDQANFVTWRSGFSNHSVTSFRVISGDGRWLVRDPVGVTILRDTTLFAPPFFPMLDPQPDAIASPGPVQIRTVGGGFVLVLPPPGEIRYRLPPGRFVLEGSFGIVLEKGRRLDGGAVFLGSLVGERREPPSRLFERALDPRRATDHGAQPLRILLDLEEDTELRLQTQSLRSGAPQTSWPYWTRVRIREEPPG